jgi:cytochrome c oxidase cbb3-type subunit 2
MRRRVCLAILMLCVVGRSPSWAEQPAPNLTEGRDAYALHCARCHGVDGRGDGLDAKRFYPRPRDLTLGVYKFRSTASGTPPTDEDIFHTITQGLAGSNMPDWQHLSEEARWQLVHYLKSLSPLFDEIQPEPVPVADDPGPKHADLVKGAELYQQLGCAACHGPQGRANGPSAAGLVDDWGMPIRPANLTQDWSYRGGSDPRSVMLRILAGIDGSGMPSYAEAISPDDAWQLAYYVRSLQQPAHWNLIAQAAGLDGELPDALDDPRWELAERTDVRLRNAVETDGSWAAAPTVSAVSFQVLYNDETAVFRFTWDDPTEESNPPSDAFALVLKPPGSGGDVATLQAWPYDGAPPLNLCYWTAGLFNVAREVLATSYHEMNEFRHAVTRASVSRYEDGRWTLVVYRPLTPDRPDGAAALRPELLNAFAVVVWDGGNRESRAVSPWVDLRLRTSTARVVGTQ